MQQRWDPWVKVQTGLAPVRKLPPQLAGPPVLKTTVVNEREVVQQGVRSLFVGLVFAAIAGYHGYARNDGSIFWGALWGAGGFVCPIVTLPIAFSQGFGKRS